MTKAKPTLDTHGAHHGWMVFCPACEYGHLFDGRWTFNGNVDAPTFTPSMLVNGTLHATNPEAGPRCHSFVTDGRIQFLADCSHAMANQTVELPEF